MSTSTQSELQLADLSVYKLDKTLRAFCEEHDIDPEALVLGGARHPVTLPVPDVPQHMEIWLPGHRVSDYAASEVTLGPRDDIDIVILGASPDRQDRSFSRHLHGGVGEMIREALDMHGIPADRVYYTTVSRFPVPDFEEKPKDRWASAGWPFVMTELMSMSPKVILAFGSYGVKLLFGRNAKMTSMRGNLQEWNGIPVVVSVNPVQFMMGYASIETWHRDIEQAAVVAGLSRAEEVYGTVAQEDLDYRLAVTADDFEQQAESILSENPDLLVFDCEWGNDVGREEFGYTISVQVSWDVGKSCFFCLRQPGLPAPDNIIHSDEEYDRCRAALAKLLKHSPAAIGGHNVRVDVKQLLVRENIDLSDKLATAFDSMLIHHILHQDDDQGLDVLVMKYHPEFGCYWAPLENWLDNNERSASLRFGYRDIPPDILIPYGQKDADATYRCIKSLQREWEGPEYESRRNLYWNIVIKSNPAILEMETGGLLLDTDRMHELHDLFQSRYDEILGELRDLINWSYFNVNSTDQLKELLFRGTNYKGKKPHIIPDDGVYYPVYYKRGKKAGQLKEYRKFEGEGDPPDGAFYQEPIRTFDLTPAFNTDRYPKAWDEIAYEAAEFKHSPSCKMDALKIISSNADNPLAEEVLTKLVDLKVLGQFLKNFLKPPTVNEFTVVHPETGEKIAVYEDGKSFLECRSQVTNRVTGTILQTTDTGRCRMFRANLQVFPKKQEAEVKRIFKDYGKINKVKSCVVPENWNKPDKTPEEDWVITEADFQQAESWIMAIAGHDERMLTILRAGRDLHSENCVSAFRPHIPAYWAWNDNPEEGEGFDSRPSSGYEFVRRVIPFHECLDENGFIVPLVEGNLEDGLIKQGHLPDYKVWASVVKGMYGGMRTAAKSISFGIPYGRGAAALAREIQKAGVSITVDETQQVIDTFYSDYPGVANLLHGARESAILNEYVETPFGRRRYFTGVSKLSQSKQAAAQREAGNMPIQGCVADLLYQALINFLDIREALGEGCPPFKLRLVVHDAVIIEHLRKDTPQMADIIKFCMGENNTIPGTPYSLGVDIETFERWGEETIKAA